MTLQNDMDAFAAGLKSRVGGKPPKRVLKFPANGTYTPSAGVLAGSGRVFVMAKAGGGSGGCGINQATGVGCGGGGAGYEYVGWLDVTGPLAITIGAGGARKTAGGTGNPGGATSVGALLSLLGGLGGLGQGRGGVGCPGGQAGFTVASNTPTGGDGAPGMGSAVAAETGAENGESTAAKLAGTGGVGYGAGGGGGVNSSTVNERYGGAGAQGYVEIWEYE